MLSRLSSTSDAVNGPILFIAATSIFLLVAITLVMIYLTIRYHRRRNPVSSEVHGHKVLEIVWTVIPTLISFGFFWYGWVGYQFIKTAPENSIEIEVTGRQWSWLHEYDNGVQSSELYVPVDQPVKLNLKSTDVIHSYYIPAFKVKQDAVPGVSGLFVWFQANQIGDYDVFCAEYCGLSHSAMLSKVHVMSREDYDAWMQTEYEKAQQLARAAVAAEASGEGEGMAALGAALMKSKGCVACHSTDGSVLIGPSYKGLYGHTVTVMTGGKERTIKVDDDYIRRSILDPGADIVKGFQPLMPPQQGVVDDKQIKALTAYIKSLK
jgi:cytochrome c oxidase subunit 2